MPKVFCAVSSQVIAVLDNVILRFRNTGDNILNTRLSVRFGSLSIASKQRAETPHILSHALINATLQR
jgi:hypothetical protein